MENTTTKLKRATLKELWGYAVGDGFGPTFSWAFVSFYYLFFLTNVLGLGAVAAGTVLLVSKVFDAFNDVAVGMLTDKTKTRIGRYRPWLYIGSVLCGVALVLMFWAPEISTQTAKFAYALTTYLFFTWCYTMCNVSNHSLKSVITNDPKQRTYTIVPKSIFMTIGYAIVGAGALPLVNMLGGADGGGYRNTAIIFGAVAMISYLVTATAVRKHDTYDNLKDTKTPIIKEMFRALKVNKALQALSIAVGTNYFAGAIGNGILLYILMYNLGDVDLMSKVMIISVFASLPISIGIAFLIKRFDKKRLFLFGSWASMIIAISMLIFRSMVFSNVTVFLICAGIWTFLSPLSGELTWVMVPDTVEYGQWQTGKRTAGTNTSIFSFMNRLGSSLGGWILGLILGAVGFVSKADTQTVIVKDTLIYLYCLGPVFGHICSIVAMKFYPITRKFYFKMLNDIESRNSDLKVDEVV